MNNLIRGLTPREHYRLHGTLPGCAIEPLLDESDDLARLHEAAVEVLPDLNDLAALCRENFDRPRVRKFQAAVRGLAS